MKDGSESTNDSNDLLVAAQYAYDNYLSKPYTNKRVQFDWEYKAKDGTLITRPNHNLAHSLRGASYAPTVVEYFSQFAKDKDQFQFTADQVEKMQIALMFRVAGRENDGGFTDNAADYLRYQQQHADAFRQYCKDNPGKFTDEEVEKYADVLQTYAAPGQNDPVKLIFKACHNIDLLRCADNKRMERELAPIVEQIGVHTKDLVRYADRCIQATGTRIYDTSPITGTPSNHVYDDALFVPASKDPSRCMALIASVPKPKPTIPAFKATLVGQILSEFSQQASKPLLDKSDYEKLARVLPTAVSPVKMLEQMAQIKESLNDPYELQKFTVNATSLLTELIKANPNNADFKAIGDYILNQTIPDNPNSQKIVENINKVFPDLPAAKNVMEPSIRQSRQHAANLSALLDQTTAVLTAGTPAPNTKLNSKMQKEKLTTKSKELDDEVKKVAADLFNVSMLMLSKIQPSEIATLPSAKEHTRHLAPNVMNLINLSNNIGIRVRDDILLCKSVKEQKNMYLFYVKLLDECVQNRNFHAAMSVLGGLSNINVERLTYLSEDSKVTAMFQKNVEVLSVVGSFKNYRDAIASSDKPYIPAFLVILANLTGVLENNPNIIENNVENLTKVQLVANQMAIIQAAQEKGAKLFQQTPPISIQTDIITRIEAPQLSVGAASLLSQAILPRKNSERKQEKPFANKLKVTAATVKGLAELEPAITKPPEPPEAAASTPVAEQQPPAPPTIQEPTLSEAAAGPSVTTPPPVPSRKPSMASGTPPVASPLSVAAKAQAGPAVAKAAVQPKQAAAKPPAPATTITRYPEGVTSSAAINAYKELVANERSYVSKINRYDGNLFSKIYEGYKENKDNVKGNKAFISVSELEQFFDIMRTIKTETPKLIAALEKGDLSEAGKILQSLNKTYADYVALQTRVFLDDRKQVPPFVDDLYRDAKSAAGLKNDHTDFSELLREPMQRVARYQLTTKEIVKDMPEGTTPQALQDFKVTVENLAENANKSVKLNITQFIIKLQEIVTLDSMTNSQAKDPMVESAKQLLAKFNDVKVSTESVQDKTTKLNEIFRGIQSDPAIDKYIKTAAFKVVKEYGEFTAAKPEIVVAPPLPQRPPMKPLTPPPTLVTPPIKPLTQAPSVAGSPSLPLTPPPTLVTPPIKSTTSTLNATAATSSLPKKPTQLPQEMMKAFRAKSRRLSELANKSTVAPNVEPANDRNSVPRKGK